MCRILCLSNVESIHVEYREYLSICMMFGVQLGLTPNLRPSGTGCDDVCSYLYRRRASVSRHLHIIFVDSYFAIGNKTFIIIIWVDKSWRFILAYRLHVVIVSKLEAGSWPLLITALHTCEGQRAYHEHSCRLRCPETEFLSDQSLWFSLSGPWYVREAWRIIKSSQTIKSSKVLKPMVLVLFVYLFQLISVSPLSLAKAIILLRAEEYQSQCW